MFLDAVLQHDADVGRHDACSRFFATRGRAGSRMNQAHAPGGAALEPQTDKKAYGNMKLRPMRHFGNQNH